MDFLTQKKLMVPVAGLLLVSAGSVYAIFYAPLTRELQKESVRLAAAEKEVSSAHAAIASYNTPNAAGLGRRLLTEQEAPEAIDELSKAARIQKVRLVSLSPGQPVESGADYRTQALELEADSTFQDLGIFLGGLEKLPKGIITVKGWDATPDPKAAAKLKSRLTLELYLESTEKMPPVPLNGLAAPQRTAKKSRAKNWDANPFVPQKEASPEVLPGLVLNGIAYDQTRPAAILNDQIVKAGDTVGPYKVVAIYPEKVIVSDGFSETEIRLSSAQRTE